MGCRAVELCVVGVVASLRRCVDDVTVDLVDFLASPDVVELFLTVGCCAVANYRPGARRQIRPIVRPAQFLKRQKQFFDRPFRRRNFHRTECSVVLSDVHRIVDTNPRGRVLLSTQ